MAFVDEYQFHAEAGKGGDGVVRWRREKFRPHGGPCGGDGGKGGDVYIEAVRDLMALTRAAHTHAYQAAAGEPGADNSKTGANGEDLTIKLPVGSVIYNVNTDGQIELLREGERVRVLTGGVGGYGNEHFKSATNQRPEHSTHGKDGDAATFRVELRMIADIGLIGLPNAGKTSLLNALTNAHARVAAYPFTTLDPNLGVLGAYIIADIPGLIEGASSGRGLGHKFLRHISRTKLLVHCISLEGDNISNDYNTVRDEVRQYPGVDEKEEYVLFTKYDTVSTELAVARVAAFKEEVSANVLGTVTVLDDVSVGGVAKRLTALLREAERVSG